MKLSKRMLTELARGMYIDDITGDVGLVCLHKGTREALWRRGLRIVENSYPRRHIVPWHLVVAGVDHFERVLGGPHFTTRNMIRMLIEDHGHAFPFPHQWWGNYAGAVRPMDLWSEVRKGNLCPIGGRGEGFRFVRPTSNVSPVDPRRLQKLLELEPRDSDAAQILALHTRRTGSKWDAIYED